MIELRLREKCRTKTGVRGPAGGPSPCFPSSTGGIVRGPVISLRLREDRPALRSPVDSGSPWSFPMEHAKASAYCLLSVTAGEMQ